MTIAILLMVAAAGLAFANGANDNFKGVATLFGSGTSEYRPTLIFANLTTLAGSCAAFVWAEALMKAFSGAGLVPPAIATDGGFIASVAMAAGATVLLATRLGFPISTTHALTGALVGAGLVAGGGVNWAKLGSAFLLPLAVSPFVAFTLALGLYPLLQRLRLSLGIESRSCVCVSETAFAIAPVPANATALDETAGGTALTIPSLQASRAGCSYTGTVAGVSAQSALDSLHYLSAGAVSFARGLNDTPKIAALLVAGAFLGKTSAVAVVALFIAVGGWLAAGRVAETMSHRITSLNTGQGFTANLITSFLVIVASRWGLPVSTTQVSCGALFGIGTTTGAARWKTMGGIVGSWVITLPLSATLAGAGYLLIGGLR
jgi:PiT family inorganic phosphate transporter